MATSLSVESGTKSSQPVRGNDGVLRVGVIGYGYWGPNIVRNFHGQDQLPRRRGLRQEPEIARSRPPCVPRRAHHQRCEGTADLAGYRRSRRRHARVDPLRAGQDRPRKRQTRVRRKAFHLHRRASRRTHRARRPQELENHGRPHLLVHRRRTPHQGIHRRRNARASSTTTIRRA